MDEESLVSGSQVEAEDDALSKYEKVNRSIMQFNKDINSLERLAESLADKLRAPLKGQQNCEREECYLLRRKVEACREDYDRIKEMIRENSVSERIQSVYDMLSEIIIHCSREHEKLYLEYMDAIHMMNFKLEKAHEDNMLLLQNSMIMRIQISSVDFMSYRCLSQNPGLMTQLVKYDVDNFFLVLLKEHMDVFMKMVSDVDPVLLDDLLLKEESMNLNWESCTILEEKSDVILKLNKNGENVYKVEERNVRDKSEVEAKVDDPSSDGCGILGDDSESTPPLDLRYYYKLTQPLHPRVREMDMKLVATLLGNVEYYCSILKEQENKRCDMLKQQYKHLEREVHLFAGRMFEENACYSRQVDSLAILVSVVTDKYAEKMQTMSSKLGSVIKWIKSRYEFILQENVRLRRLIGDQKTKYYSAKKNVGTHICGKMDTLSPLNKQLHKSCMNGEWKENGGM